MSITSDPAESIDFQFTTFDNGNTESQRPQQGINATFADQLEEQYVTHMTDAANRTIDFYNEQFAVGPICFVRDTPIKTDQGEIKIQEINKNVHTINGKNIIAITKTILDGELLIRVEKNALGEDCPNHSVVMSGNHKILYGGKLIMAKDLALNMPGKLNYMKYMGDPLYNVLMEKHDTMIVNNMVVETLHPDNKIAILYKNLLKKCNTNTINIDDYKKIYKNLCNSLDIKVC